MGKAMGIVWWIISIPLSVNLLMEIPFSLGNKIYSFAIVLPLSVACVLFFGLSAYERKKENSLNKNQVPENLYS